MNLYSQLIDCYSINEENVHVQEVNLVLITSEEDNADIIEWSRGIYHRQTSARKLFFVFKF